MFVEIIIDNIEDIISAKYNTNKHKMGRYEYALHAVRAELSHRKIEDGLVGVIMIDNWGFLGNVWGWRGGCPPEVTDLL